MLYYFQSNINQLIPNLKQFRSKYVTLCFIYTHSFTFRLRNITQLFFNPLTNGISFCVIQDNSINLPLVVGQFKALYQLYYDFGTKQDGIIPMQ